MYNIAKAKGTTNRKELEMLQIMRTYKAEKNQGEAQVVFDHSTCSWRAKRIKVRISFNGNPFDNGIGFDSYDEAEEFVLTCDSFFHRVVDGKVLPRPEWADEKIYIKQAEMDERLREYRRAL